MSTPLRGVDGSVTLANLANVKLRAWSATPRQNVVDITSFASAGWAETIGTLKSLSGSVSGQVDAAMVSVTSTLSGTPAGITLTASGALTATYTGNGIVNNFTVTQVVEGVATVSADFVSSGAWS